MKIKTLVLQGTASAPPAAADLFDSPHFDVCQVVDTDVIRLPAIVSRLQPDLILCQDRFREMLFKMEESLPGALPFIFFDDTAKAAPVMPITQRQVAYLALPIGAGVLSAVVQLMLGTEIMP